jgi:DNA-binding Lrp family transcriptional regulator
MGKMKDLVMEVLDLYNDERLPMSEIASMVDLSVPEVEAIIEEWSEVIS